MTVTHNPMPQPFRIDRTATALVLATLVLLLVAGIRKDISGPPPYRIQQDQFSWCHCADIVLLGDSRMNRGVAPSILGQELPNLRIRNFGINGNGYSARYLDAAGKVLDPASPYRTLILGITPISLTDNNCKDQVWTDQLELANSGLPLPRWTDGLLSRMMPIKPHTLIRSLQPGGTIPSDNEFFTDGWVAENRWSSNEKNTLEYYRGLFLDNPVRPGNVQRLLNQVRQWRQAGIAVYAFRPPTTPEMVALESQLSGFDEEAFQRAFTDAGGIWLHVKPFAYHTPDGSHLYRSAAIELSRDLAQLLKPYLQSQLCAYQQPTAQ